jgi:hypothetical protein
MKYRLVKLRQISGNKTSIYSVYVENDEKTLFDRFLTENKISFKDELKDILTRLNSIAHKTGAREQFFKIDEGKPGDGVCALYDNPDKKLRLYCIRYASLILVLGGGDPKPKPMRAFQESSKLTEENYILRKISEDITRRLEDKEIYWSDDYMDFRGNLEFNDEDYE